MKKLLVGLMLLSSFSIFAFDCEKFSTNQAYQDGVITIARQVVESSRAATDKMIKNTFLQKTNIAHDYRIIRNLSLRISAGIAICVSKHELDTEILMDL